MTPKIKRVASTLFPLVVLFNLIFRGLAENFRTRKRVHILGWLQVTNAAGHLSGFLGRKRHLHISQLVTPWRPSSLHVFTTLLYRQSISHDRTKLRRLPAFHTFRELVFVKTLFWSLVPLVVWYEEVFWHGD